MIRFDLCRLPGSSRLFCDYVRREPAAVSLFALDPFDPGSLKAQATALAGRDYHREQLAAVLEEQNRAWGADEAALENCRRLKSGNCLAVVTGQQVGLLGGPLFTAVKALHAVRLAGHIERELGQPVVPIFWLELEDHDLEEISRLTVKDAQHGLNTLVHTPEVNSGRVSRRPVKDILLGRDIERLKHDLAALWPKTEHSEELWRILDNCYSAVRSFAEGFALVHAHFLSRFGIVLADPSQPEFKRSAAHVFASDISEPLTAREDFTSHSEKIISTGYHIQVETKPEQLQLFLIEEGEKRRIAADGDRFRLVGAQERFGREKLISISKTEPERLVPAVLLRPLVQDTLFPTVAYVAGPAEVAYLAQTKPLYTALGVPMPLVMPRSGVTLIGSNAHRTVRTYGIDLPGGELFQDRDELVQHILEEHSQARFREHFRKARLEVADAITRLISGLDAVDEGFAKAAGSAGQKIDYQIDRLEKKYRQAVERKNRATVHRLIRLANTLYPQGVLQERAFPVAQFINLYGSAIFNIISDSIDPVNPAHSFIFI